MAAVMRTAVCLSIMLSVCQVSGSYIPQEMNRTLQNLNKHYKISVQDMFDGKHVFPRELLKGSIQSKMLYMGGILETYEKMIGHMTGEMPTLSPQIAKSKEKSVTSSSSTVGSEVSEEIRPKLMYILEKIQKLKDHRYQEQVKLLHGLQALRHIKMNDTVIQGKALRELPWIYQEASSLADDIVMKRRRRRRQARNKSRQVP